MNKFFFSIVGFSMAMLTSCQFSENIYMNDNGSGTMVFTIDASELMQMAGEELKSENGGKAMDSTIVFKDILASKRDSIALLSPEEQARLRSMENFKLHLVSDPETKKMRFDLSTEFKDASELQDMFKAMNSFNSLQDTGSKDTNTTSNPFSSTAENSSTEVNYSFQNNVFKREGIIIDKELHQQAMDSLGQTAMMLGGSNYTINYHFPKPVKAVSNADALLSQDRKTVTLQVGLMELLKSPALLDIEVTLED